MSPEAAAAAEAVEEVQEREAWEDAREETVVAAAEASLVAEAVSAEAEQSAQEAAQIAVTAIEVAAETAQQVEEVRVEIAEATDDRGPCPDCETLRAQMAPLLELQARAEADQLAAEHSPDETQVQEVDVEDGIKSGGNSGDSGNGTGDADSGSDGGGTARHRRHGLRRGRK